MQEILYIEVPTSDTAAVRDWLHQFLPGGAIAKQVTPDGIRLTYSEPLSSESLPHAVTPSTFGQSATSTAILLKDQLPSELSPELPSELSIFVWSLQRTTYLKAFRWAKQPLPQERKILQQMTRGLRDRFPNRYPEPPAIDLTQQTIFEALGERYPKTVHYFQEIPNGEYDLTRVYWWEQRWREGVKNPQQPKQVIFRQKGGAPDFSALDYDLIYIGGALGVVHSAMMAQLGYRVLLIERMPFGNINREWNISRGEFQTLIDLGLFTSAEFESVIAREYVDGFNKFFDANNPPQSKAAVLHTPTVLNIAIDAEKFLKLCGEKLRSYGGEIWDETEFFRADVGEKSVTIQAKHLPTQKARQASGRLLVDAMGTASPIAWQINGGHAFDSVCPTVGAVIDGGFEPGVWDALYGDVLNSHGDISRGRQLIWELFPGRGNELTFYLFHYHQVHPENPGSLLEMYEDFFTILPEYRRCDMGKLKWRKATFGYIPGHFSIRGNDRTVAFDRLMAIGDAASLQSPLVFTGFGSLIRNLPRLTDLLDTALRHDLLKAKHLNQIRAFQSNIAVTWLFSKGMMVPTGKFLAPQKVNSMLNTFFGILSDESPEVADRFIKDRAGWVPFNRMAIKAAWQNPALLLWIWELAGAKDLIRWVGSYLNFSFSALMSWLFSWVPRLSRNLQPWLEPRYPALWFWLLTRSYALTYGMGKPQDSFVQVRGKARSPQPQPPVLAKPLGDR
ncbi:MAG: flavin-dependent dehydrogenase [Drouetiella hepatica Uher 2000/2452]|jgi:lycopene cyclase CruA|uniref:Flavin-dependent dehydrogenase n=1 Tax=Drouetiella hepatica Uher 2000/2452 TaxID=904376 RepID=A0A951UR42_9CYAN|nr:flavin-dependent dehydrogenase [Drouetiella hepatica Uher 2000/2452]